MTQPTEKRTCLSKHLIVSCYKRIKERLLLQWCTWIPLALLLIILGYIGFWTIIEKPLEGGPWGAILSLFAWMVVWTIGPSESMIFIARICKAIASLKAGEPKPAIDLLPSQGAYSFGSNQSFNNKYPDLPSLPEDNLISKNNSVDANVENITKSAKKGDKEAQFSLGLMYAERKGTPQDDKQAVHWYTKSAKQDDARAQNELGLMYNNGRGVPQDYKQAVHWYTKSAEQGFAAAQYNLGLMYDNGRGVPQDYEKAIDWYTKSAEQGVARAQNNLGVMYDNGRGVPAR